MYLYPPAVACLLSFLSTTYTAYQAIYPENKVSFVNLENLESSDLLTVDKARRDQFPYHISLQRDEGNEFHHICSGAILSNKWVVSTAYCVTLVEGPFKVVVGVLVKNELHPDVQVADVETTVIHPDYKGWVNVNIILYRELSENDIALLKLKNSLIFSKSVQPIFLPGTDLEEIWGAAVLSGWNIQAQRSKQLFLDPLYYMVVFIMAGSECEYALLHMGNFSSKMLCSEKSKQAIFCPGESGAPLVHNGYLIGLTSWGTVPCDITVYTKVVSFVRFIKIYM